MKKDNSSDKRIEDLRKEIEKLPKGYISRKNIYGKVRCYLQWRSGSKVKSRYVKAAELEEMEKLIAVRKQLEEELKTLKLGRSVGSFVAEDGISYTAAEPAKYLMWEDAVIGHVFPDFSVKFVAPNLNPVVAQYTEGSEVWTPDEFRDFLQERIPSPDRRDIDSLLAKMGAGRYDVFEIAKATRGICARDLLWIADSEDEKFRDSLTEVFESVFLGKKDLTGESVDTPEGMNVKRYGAVDGRYGIFKRRISPITTDVESELAVFGLAELMGIECCPCEMVDDDTVFSLFKYDFTKEYIVHFRRIVSTERDGNLLEKLISARPEYFADFVRMIVLDFVTRQDDRHLSNIAVKMSGKGESFYPLYDNGRSLFYEDTEELASKAPGDIATYSTAFGSIGSYYDHIVDLSNKGVSFGKLVNLKLSEKDVRRVLESSGFRGYRLEGGIKWITECLKMLKQLG